VSAAVPEPRPDRWVTDVVDVAWRYEPDLDEWWSPVLRESMSGKRLDRERGPLTEVSA
jgi:hypothetical protein